MASSKYKVGPSFLSKCAEYLLGYKGAMLGATVEVALRKKSLLSRNPRLFGKTYEIFLENS